MQNLGGQTKSIMVFCEVANLSASLRLIFGVSSCLFGTLPLYLPFCSGTLKLGKYYIQYSFRVRCYLNALSLAFIEI